MKPHKCPVCDGAGEFVYTVGELPEKCKACDGTGIVWPPLGYYPPYMPPSVPTIPPPPWQPQWPQHPWTQPNTGTPCPPVTWCYGGLFPPATS